MDDTRVGRTLRTLRRRLGWRQVDVGSRSGTSQQLISLLERGQLEAVSLRALRRVARSVDAQITVELRWRGGELDRLVDEQHAKVVQAIRGRLAAAGWEMAVEVTYSVYGERGSIDVLAWRGAERALLIVEAKSAITSGEATLRKHDEKARLARRIVAERFGWQPRTVSRLLVVADTRTARRRVAAGGGLLAHAYPVAGATFRLWLRQPAGEVAGLMFVPVTSLRSAGRRIDRATTASRDRPPAARARPARSEPHREGDARRQEP